ncbi:hypothetical protein Clacol_001294 [Clathrus columnatus]|uniref:AFG1-like ATPase n=1 Tax=Clathrus columnatus TaxID=1419009 RepID=A0AAV4ZYV9_9AGAM|nr:hypothetical protein Clacol_001294 [Clathrus columnatus]
MPARPRGLRVTTLSLSCSRSPGLSRVSVRPLNANVSAVIPIIRTNHTLSHTPSGHLSQQPVDISSFNSTHRNHGRPGLKDTSADVISIFKEVPSLTPRTRYHELVAQGIIRDDPYQRTIIDKLQNLHDELKSYDRPIIPLPSRPSLLDKLFNRSPTPETLLDSFSSPKGLYLYGDVGTGKSMLMDLFYDTLPPNVRRKRRAHFHAFMIDVHKRVHAVKTSAGHNGIADPILPVARDLANEATVLCFDEFQVTDIVDAMILRRLFECLLQFGVVSVMTSNRHPDELYKNGIQRSSFIPCIELIKSRFGVTDLDSGTDYRRIPRALNHVYYHPLTPENGKEMKKLFNAMAGDAPVVYDKQLMIWGRALTVPESAGKIAKFTFNQLCGQPLSAADYIELTREFHTIFLLDVPQMGLNQKDLTKLLTTSAVPIHQVFSDDAAESKSLSDHQRSVMDDLGISTEVGTSSLFSGEEEVFAFARACSRLVQMGTKEWALTAKGD